MSLRRASFDFYAQTDAVQNFADLIKNARTLEAVEMTG